MFATEAIVFPPIGPIRLRAQVLTEADQESKHWVNSQLDFKEYLTQANPGGVYSTRRGSVALNCSADQFAGALPNTT